MDTQQAQFVPDPSRFLTRDERDTARTKILTLQQLEAWFSYPHRGKPMSDSVKNVLRNLFYAIDNGKMTYALYPDIDLPGLNRTQINSVISGCYSFFETRVHDYWISRSFRFAADGRLCIFIDVIPGVNNSHGHRKGLR